MKKLASLLTVLCFAAYMIGCTASEDPAANGNGNGGADPATQAPEQPGDAEHSEDMHPPAGNEEPADEGAEEDPGAALEEEGAAE